jgi:hypothetical protein
MHKGRVFHNLHKEGQERRNEGEAAREFPAMVREEGWFPFQYWRREMDQVCVWVNFFGL